MKFLPFKPPTAVVILLILIFTQLSTRIYAQPAPVTTAATITNATTGTGATIVPITVRNFVSIGAFTLTLRYKLAYATYVSASSHPSCPGTTVTHSIDGAFGKIVINWPQTSGGLTLPDETVLVNLTFTYKQNNCVLTWYYSGFGNVCQYKRYSNGTYTTILQSPKQDYYINGGFANRGAPVATLPNISNPAPGALAVPITMNAFTAIGANNLSIEYDSTVLLLQTVTKNDALPGTVFNYGTMIGQNGKKIVNIGYVAPTTASLSNGATAYTMNFIYSVTNGSCSELNFLNVIGADCGYASETADPFFDVPTSSYYNNGSVYTVYSPKAWLPTLPDATPSSTVALPVSVSNFNNVRSFNLTFEYDGTVMTYNNFTPNAEFGSEMTVTDSPSGSKRKIVINWTGTANKTLPDGSILAHVNFNYGTGSSPLSWIITDETSCRFNDANGNCFYHWPMSSYYMNGLIGSHTAPKTIINQQSATAGQNVTVPVVVYDYSNIGLFSLALDYDPSVLTYQSTSLAAGIGGTFTASTSGLGRLLFDWSGTAATLPDNTNLFNIVFTYNGGSSALAWYDYSDSCRYKETVAGTSLYDSPQSQYYINGYVGPSPLTANFTANNTSGDLNATINLTDLSTGSPTGWNWSLSPSTYYFVNGTSASSQNPQVKFTTNGAYTVTLIATKGTTGAAEVKTDYLHIGTPGLWTGITSSDWNTGSNWHNYAVPSSSVNVLIPSAAANWPVINGNLNIGGAQCLNLTVQGPAQLTVNGNLSISGTSGLTFTGSGSLFLSGNFTNNGNFTCGTSTVTFTGTTDANVTGNGSTLNFYRIIVTKNPGKVYFQGDVNVLGNN